MQRVVRNWKPPSLFVMPTATPIQNGIGKGRQYTPLAAYEFRDEAFSCFGFTELRDEPIYKNFAGHHYLDGAFTQPHKDFAPEGFIHVRANWMLQKPASGGNPVMDGAEVEVNPGDLWICFASEELHSSTPISGGERLICSFGALIKRPANFNIKDSLQ